MAALNISLKLTLNDVNQISASLKQDWVSQTKVLGMKLATDEERLDAHRSLLTIERVLRELGVDVSQMKEDFKRDRSTEA